MSTTSLRYPAHPPSTSLKAVAAPVGVVIVGAGLAGLTAAEALRAAQFTGPITLLGDEVCGPYQRPPLSKDWLLGDLAASSLALRDPEKLLRLQIDVRTGVAVASIDRQACHVVLGSGEVLPYAGLVLATGSRPRTLALPGANAPGVLTLRSPADATLLSKGLARCAAQMQPLVVIGGGFIGLEVAATARSMGVAVTVLEAAPRLLSRALAPVMSDWFAHLHRSHGVQLLLGAAAEQLETGPDGWVRGVRLASGQLLPAGLVLVGVGTVPNDALAQAAGLPCDRGIVVDACSRTADPLIVAAGDCTVRRQPDGSLLRLESVQNATEQAKGAAAALLGQRRPFGTTPWFWSDQYGHKLQMVGLSAGADQSVPIGDMSGSRFCVEHYRQNQLLAVDCVNSPRDFLAARKRIDQPNDVLPVGS